MSDWDPRRDPMTIGDLMLAMLLAALLGLAGNLALLMIALSLGEWL